MRNRTRTICLYSKLGTVLRQIGRGEGAAMEATGTAHRVVRKIDGRYELAGYQLRELLRADGNSPCAITPREMRIHAGLERVSRGRMAEVESKVAGWSPRARCVYSRDVAASA